MDLNEWVLTDDDAPIDAAAGDESLSTPDENRIGAMFCVCMIGSPLGFSLPGASVQEHWEHQSNLMVERVTQDTDAER